MLFYTDVPEKQHSVPRTKVKHLHFQVEIVFICQVRIYLDNKIQDMSSSQMQTSII